MFGANLKKLREDSHLSQEQLADAIGVSKSTIGMYEQGKRMPNTNTILKDIASYFGVSIDYLVGFHQEGAGVTDEDFSRFGLRPIHRRRIPMLGKIACGEPIMCEEEYETFADSGADIDADFCVIAQGDSMINARIFDGDIVFVRKQEMVENGEIAVVIVNDNEVTLKRFFYYPELNQVVLQSENPSFRPMIYMNEELSHIRVLGKAVAFTSSVI
ncbi:MAG: helix-turn-helix domain-containing protein [Clostridia bacterium]|nr:helix-turn-helix domain-containing protein [Clostridia bacterium]